jgi:hypothetical protein
MQRQIRRCHRIVQAKEDASYLPDPWLLMPHNDHGNPDHLTIEGLEQSARADNMNLDEAVASLVKTVDAANAKPSTITASA